MAPGFYIGDIWHDLTTSGSVHPIDLFFIAFQAIIAQITEHTTEGGFRDNTARTAAIMKTTKAGFINLNMANRKPIRNIGIGKARYRIH